MKPETRDKIINILNKCVEGAIRRTKENKSFRPFHEALLTKELVNAAAFERSFSTSFGQGPVEEISSIIAIDAGYQVIRSKQTYVNLYKGAIDEIERLLSALRAGEKRPNWEQEVKRITAFNKGDTEVRRVISDLWLEKDGIETFISIKTVKPNLDQTERAKKDLLLLKAHNEQYHTYFGLFYNPGGPEKINYNWSVPSKIFDMRNDPCVLIGRDYWDTLGGAGTYDTLLAIFAEVGMNTRGKILYL
ncbi:MAG: TdeIII family type II restriction endonuclease [Saprospiraceae bacterium]